MVKPAPSSPRPLVVVPQQPAVENRNEELIKYKGVRKRKWGKYVSEIRLPNSRERIWLGSYDTAEKAARAFDAAQFCLRGNNAVFNIPNDQPNIINGQSLTPAEIQVVAAQYANNITSNNQQAPTDTQSETITESEGRSFLSSSEGMSGDTMESIDWSFWDELDSYATGNNSDFNFFFSRESFGEDIYDQPNFARDDNDNYYDVCGNEEGQFSEQSFLWNF